MYKVDQQSVFWGLQAPWSLLQQLNSVSGSREQPVGGQVQEQLGAVPEVAQRSLLLLPDSSDLILPHTPICFRTVLSTTHQSLSTNISIVRRATKHSTWLISLRRAALKLNRRVLRKQTPKGSDEDSTTVTANIKGMCTVKRYR